MFWSGLSTGVSTLRGLLQSLPRLYEWLEAHARAKVPCRRVLTAWELCARSFETNKAAVVLVWPYAQCSDQYQPFLCGRVVPFSPNSHFRSIYESPNMKWTQFLTSDSALYLCINQVKASLPIKSAQ